VAGTTGVEPLSLYRFRILSWEDIYTFRATKQADLYRALGPNSNTWAAQLLSNAGYGAPKPPGATGWDYSGSFKYGGEYFTTYGESTPKYDEFKTSWLNALGHYGENGF
jgi:hypothetical protein